MGEAGGRRRFQAAYRAHGAKGSKRSGVLRKCVGVTVALVLVGLVALVWHAYADLLPRARENLYNEQSGAVEDQHGGTQALRGPQDPMRYWLPFQDRPLHDPQHILQPRASKFYEKYVTFEDDTGGWNNIRMAFEVFVLVAKATGRILVVPPQCRFYLLDRGPITAFDKKTAERKSQTSTYEQYYDFKILQKHVRVITTEEFFRREALTMGISSEKAQRWAKPQKESNGHHTDYFLWLREQPFVEIWPSGPQVRGKFNLEKNPSTNILSKVLHFPMHVSKNLRYLSGIPALLTHVQPSTRLAVMEFVRAGLVYATHIYKAAEIYVRLMGGFNKYAAMHVRRNELQYKHVFLPGKQSAENVMPLVRNGEPIYLATDEMQAGFFDHFQSNGIKVVRMADLRERVTSELGEPLEAKFEGMVEQIVCACGRWFAGTPMSTFSAHIFRLRHYMHANAKEKVETAEFYHTISYVEDENIKGAVAHKVKSFHEEVFMGFFYHE